MILFFCMPVYQTKKRFQNILMTPLLLLCILISILPSSLLISASTNQTINSLLDAREASLRTLVKAAEAATLRRCEFVANYSPSTRPCQIYACGNQFPTSRGFSCTRQFGVDDETCASAEHSYCTGLTRSIETSTVIFPPSMSNDNLEGQEFLAYSESISDVVTEELKSKRIKAWVGWGGPSGVHRVWPGAPRSKTQDGSPQCSPYTVFLRPWYSSASIRPRDFILCMDVSGSLFQTDCRGCKSRGDLMIEGALTLLDTLTHLDCFAIVTFSGVNTGTILTGDGKPTLLYATDENKAAARKAILSVRTSGLTNFESAMKQAFRIFRETTVTTGCLRTIMLMTDGSPNDESTIDGYIEREQSTLSRPAHIFTITMSSGATLKKARSITCGKNRGVHQHIPNGIPPGKALGTYLKFLSLGTVLNSSTSNIAWSSVYTDSLGLGRMSTVSSRIVSNGVMTSVISIDVPIQEFLELGTLGELETELSKRSSSCANIDMTDCLLQKLRNESGYECSDAPSYQQCLDAGNVTADDICPEFSDPPNTNPITKAGGVNALVCEDVNFENNLPASGAEDYDEIVCCDCQLRTSTIVMIVVVSVSFVFLVGLIVTLFMYREKIRMKCCGEQDDNKEQQKNATQNNNNHDDHIHSSEMIGVNTTMQNQNLSEENFDDEHYHNHSHQEQQHQQQETHNNIYDFNHHYNNNNNNNLSPQNSSGSTAGTTGGGSNSSAHSSMFSSHSTTTRHTNNTGDESVKSGNASSSNDSQSTRKTTAKKYEEMAM